ncbi:MAG: hypothetical protein JW894_13710 [Bacteroidales bacterium]|nr:hypothetical protein [Bacteroidales bacterium]
MIQPDAVPGDVIFVDRNGDGVIDAEDKTMIGNPHPDFTYGFSANLEYKGFDFSILLQGVYGNDIVNGIRTVDRYYSNYSTEILGRWQWEDLNGDEVVNPGESNGSTIPRVTDNSERNHNYVRFSELYIEDGSYLKIRSIIFGYDFSKVLLKNTFVSQLRIYFAVNNVYTFTKYKGLDPEIGYGDYDWERYSNMSTGIDLGYYPVPRSYVFGLNVKF